MGNKLTVIVVFLLGIIIGGSILYIAYPPKRTIIEGKEISKSEVREPIVITQEIMEEMMAVVVDDPFAMGAIGLLSFLIISAFKAVWE